MVYICDYICGNIVYYFDYVLYLQTYQEEFGEWEIGKI